MVHGSLHKVSLGSVWEAEVVKAISLCSSLILETSGCLHTLTFRIGVAWGLSPSWVGHAQFRRPTTRVTVVLV